MVTIHLRYIIDPYKLVEFEEYGRRWITLVNRLGGDHHGYFMPSEGNRRKVSRSSQEFGPVVV